MGFPAELFDLQTDPEERVNLAVDAAFAETVREMHAELLQICDPQRIGWAIFRPFQDHPSKFNASQLLVAA